MADVVNEGPSSMATLVYNPLTPLKSAIDAMITKRISKFLAENNCDMYLLGLTEDTLVDGAFDWSRYEVSARVSSSGRRDVLLTRRPQSNKFNDATAQNTALLALLDTEKKKITALRTTVSQSDMEKGTSPPRVPLRRG